ncbi:MAG TPA: metallopeptidase TldD-related protein [Candidatus Eremiobacteraeota bacterium]|nr:MAG: peptidase PmbA [bacterium ADurb.Bin363]HPZ06484.1 metallopeptidase TldD-related protein [Candidatus Eremiobacteraeota bacterium]
MEKMLELVLKKVDEAEILSVMTQSSLIRYDAGKLNDIINRDVQEFSLRVIHKGRLGNTCGNSYDIATELVDKALLSAKYGQKVDFHFPSESGDTRQIFDAEMASLGPEELLVIADEIIEKTLSLAPHMHVNLQMQKTVKHTRLINSNGKDNNYQQTLLDISVTGLLKGSKEGVNRCHISGKLSPFPDAKIKELVREYSLIEKHCSVPTKRMAVMFTPRCIWALLHRFKEAINGESILKGTSPLTKKLGEKIFPSVFTIIDDPTLEYFPHTSPIDDEGTPTKKKFLIEEGVLKNFLFDLSTGSRYGNGSSGNGYKRGFWSSSIDMSPTPNTSTMVLLPGDNKELISGMKEGIIADYLVGAHSGNVLLGDLSVNVGIGFYVKNGEILGRAMDSMIAGNIYKLFENIQMIGAEPELDEFSSSYYTPPLLFNDISVSGKG